ncbi:crossover junction endodeoxyribonuclease RuvC [Patescibacteria group bacterium]|nr:crossover junction endodeoxyribonuclease RuvC [Patescibacteria group bacterium]MBU1124002.1 crossover junction endodeoxyribonuclease RuvC [Patescibacteria group bacterium]MBU1911363.1 crossover junction endodeoxyribonuclease RuvC [Patescibacteria group bacterium]
MKIIGIDPGIATTGIGLIETSDNRIIENSDWFTISTPANTPLSDRLEELENDLSEYLEKTKPDLAVVEKLFFAANTKTAIDVAQARGVILLTLKSRNIAIIEPTPLEMKSCITGDGKADKLQIQTMIMRELKLDEPPKPDDAADAVGLALYGSYNFASIEAIS